MNFMLGSCSSGTITTMRILVVEDEERLAVLIKRGLESKGYAVDFLTDGADAKKRILLYRNEYDVIILDLMLPGADGHEICRTVRGDGVTVPIIVLSARNETENKIELLNSGADDYLEKPFSFSELEARIAALMRRPKETLPTKLQSQDGVLALDKRTHSVTIGDNNVMLTLKEFMLLEYFLRNPNAVIARDELLEHAWDFNYSAFSNVVDVHVKNLRKKLEQAGADARIETIRGVGYRFVG